jgi:hypothetical protein
MKKTLMGLLCVVLLLSACQKQMQKFSQLDAKSLSPSFKSGSSLLLAPTAIPCGTPLVADLVTSSYPPFDEVVKGKVVISNDGTNLYVTISTLDSAAVKVSSIQLFYGNLALISDINNYSWDGWFGTNNPQIKVQVSTVETSYTVQIPLSTFNEDCFLINVHALFYTFNEWGQRVEFPVWIQPADAAGVVSSFPWTGYLKYCKQTCIPPTCGQLRTQTPGGWGAKPSGKNPGTYLHANFQQAFPTGLTVGCATGNTIKLTSAQAITDLLPTGGKAQKLTMSYVNPADIDNVLVGHLVALTLSVRFDAYDPAFGDAGITLGAMVIGSGPFKGYTVSAFLEEANKVLGGCSSSFTIQQVLETAAAINENYVDGKMDGKYLVCPTR